MIENHRFRYGRGARVTPVAAHGKPLQAFRTFWYPLPHHRFRPEQPDQFGYPHHLPAGAVQIPVPDRTRAQGMVPVATAAEPVRYRGATADDRR